MKIKEMKKEKLLFSVALMMALAILITSCATVGKTAGGSSAAGDNTSAPESPESTAEAARTDAEGFLLDDLPDKLNFGDQEITFLAWDGQSYEEFSVEQPSGDIIDDAIFDRNIRVEGRLGVRINVKKTKGGSSDYQAYTTAVKGDISAGNGSEYDILAAYSRTTAMCAYMGLAKDLLTTAYFDIEKPWWPKTLTEQSTIGGKLYFCSGDISLSLFHNLDVVYFNKDMATDFKIGPDSIYRLVDSGEWTLDKMISLCAGTYDDLDLDGKKSDGDRFGFICANTQSQPIVWGCGITAVNTDSDGRMTESDVFFGEKMQDVQEKLFGFINDTNDGLRASSTGTGNTAFAEGRCLFFCNIASYAMSKFKEAGISFGLLPPPKYNTDQDRYYSVEGNAFTLYAIENSDGTDPDLCSAVLEALCSEGYRSVSPTVFEVAMKVRYADDYNTSRMYDLIRGGVVFDNGRIFSGVLDDIFTRNYNDQFKSGSTAWLAKAAVVREEAKRKLDDLNQTFAALNG